MSDSEAGHLAAYLERIGLSAPPATDPAGLEVLQRAHRLTIAFENLDIRLGREIRIDSESVFDKLVTRRRGGYCFEHNQLLADMLSALGLATRPLLARARLGPPVDAHPPRTHVLLLAELGGEPWVLDAGFGGSYVPVLPLIDGAGAATADGARHRLRRIGERGSLAGEWLLERAGPFAATDGRPLPHGDWQPQYSFDLAEVAPADLEQANHWTATAAESRFTRLHIATLALPAGFASLIDRALKLSDGEHRREEDISEATRYREHLAVHFGLALTDKESAALPLFATDA